MGDLYWNSIYFGFVHHLAIYCCYLAIYEDFPLSLKSSSGFYSSWNVSTADVLATHCSSLLKINPDMKVTKIRDFINKWDKVSFQHV